MQTTTSLKLPQHFGGKGQREAIRKVGIHKYKKSN